MPFHKKGRNGKRHLVAVGLQPSRSGKMHFPAATPPVKKQLRNDRSRFGAANYKNNFSADIATATTAACGQRLPPAGGRCRIATKEGMQGGAVGAVASRMQGPLKGRSIRWEPQPVQGRGVSRGREGGVETPLSPSGPAERPRRRCRLQKPSGLPHAIALCMRNITKKHPPCGCTAGALKGSAGMLSGWCPCPQPGRRRSSQRPPRPSPGRGRSGAGPCWGCPGAC